MKDKKSSEIKDLLQLEDSSPALEGEHTVWRRPDGIIHRKYGPAISHPSGHEEWQINGIYHREDGPAITTADGSSQWFIHGERHREDGPAVTHPKKENCRYYIHGEELSEDEFLDLR